MRLMTILLSGLVLAIPAMGATPPGQTGALSLSVIGTIPGTDGGWGRAAVDEQARLLYVAHGDAVMAVNLDTGKVNPQLAQGRRLRSVLPLPDGRALATAADNSALVFEAANGKAVASIPTGTDPGAAIFDPASGLALILDRRDGEITLIDPHAATSPGKILVGGRLSDAASDGAGHAYVAVADRAEIVAVDIAERKVLSRYALAGCRRPSGVAVDPADGTLLVACANRKALALNAKDGATLATMVIAERPDGAIYDPARKLFFIPCGEGSLAVIAPHGDAARSDSAPAVIATIPTANGARAAALDPKTGKIYLPTADFEPPAPGSRRHTVIPGTFRILTVGAA